MKRLHKKITMKFDPPLEVPALSDKSLASKDYLLNISLMNRKKFNHGRSGRNSITENNSA